MFLKFRTEYWTISINSAASCISHTKWTKIVDSVGRILAKALKILDKDSTYFVNPLHNLIGVSNSDVTWLTYHLLSKYVITWMSVRMIPKCLHFEVSVFAKYVFVYIFLNENGSVCGRGTWSAYNLSRCFNYDRTKRDIPYNLMVPEYFLFWRCSTSCQNVSNTKLAIKDILRVIDK